MNKLKCKMCKHEWIKRINKVTFCPNCHSIKWKEGFVKNVGKN